MPKLKQSMENSNKRKERVIPGDELAVIEEYESGKGTHTIDGQIHSSVFGKTKFDNKNKSVEVKGPRSTSELPQVNDQVEGVLENHSSWYRNISLGRAVGRSVLSTNLLGIGRASVG